MNNRTLFIFKIIVISWFLFWGFMFYELFYPFIPFKYNIIPLPTRTPVITAGQDVILIGDYCKYVKGEANVVASFKRILNKFEIEQGISSVIVTLKTERHTNLPSGCHVTDFTIQTPVTLRAGEYVVVINIEGKINPFRVSNEEYFSVPIKVYENKKESID